MRAPRPLQRLKLLMRLQRAGRHDHRHKRQQLLELREERQAQLALFQHVIQEDETRWVLSRDLQPFGSRAGADQLIVLQRVGIDLILEIVVLDDEYAGF